VFRFKHRAPHPFMHGTRVVSASEGIRATEVDWIFEPKLSSKAIQGPQQEVYFSLPPEWEDSTGKAMESVTGTTPRSLTISPSQDGMPISQADCDPSYTLTPPSKKSSSLSSSSSTDPDSMPVTLLPFADSAMLRNVRP